MLVVYEKSDHVATITLNRPEAFNAISPEVYQEFSDTMIRFRDDPDVWVAIITGAGQKAFSAGADIKQMLPRLADKSFALPPGIMRGLNIWKPIIAAINGLALGGGLEIVLACDIRIAAENARFGTPEVSLGLIPGWGGTQRLPRMLPWCKAAEILLMGKPIDAQEAYRIGLINKVVAPAELMSTAQEWAARICENGPIAIRAAKEAMIRGMNMSLDDGLRLEESFFAGLTTTEDFKEGISAFAEKRKPQYKGE
ncbi:MAG: Short-chain-enoyl-CoA hydratase [Chloroflexi bacterium]|nr:Short-chain-enoyl-CoA hydratase [Chloroflexota bacterium]MBT9166196.1 Short-chain-enoyl-CoA hydratase [Chloroflexota bacterium]